MQAYDLNVIPFSHPDSFLTISSRDTSDGTRLAYRTSSSRLSGQRDLPFHPHDFFEIALTRDGKEIPYQWTAYPHSLDLITDGEGSARFIFLDGNTLQFETRAVGLRLLPAKPFDAFWKTSADQLHLVDHPARGLHQLRAAPGTTLEFAPSQTVSQLAANGAESPYTVDFSGPGGARGALRFTRHEGFWKEALPDFEEKVAEREREYEAWQARMPLVPAELDETARSAWFLLWNCRAPAAGTLTRPALYMSKFWMNSIWAWDNCFNALAIARADPDLAWQQLLLFFDHQEPNGMVPDMINDLEAVYGFTKPPIQGWAIRKLVEMLGVKRCFPYLEQIYKPLGHLVDWWYEQRDFDADGMPQYHHGNDSGWDNATVFDQGCPTEGADLAAYLVHQCETLAFIASILGRDKAAERWKERASQQLSALLQKGLRNGHFFAPLNGRADAPASLSLLNYMPLILGRRLPAELTASLIKDLEPDGPFLTDWGLASESPLSPKYQADGYWRGPIWAPSTYLIFDGLLDAGYPDLARLVAERFCDLCAHDPGFWENYDAHTGKGLRCPGYSWTAAVFILLAEWLAKL
jgi:putative isomerase